MRIRLTDDKDLGKTRTLDDHYVCAAGELVRKEARGNPPVGLGVGQRRHRIDFLYGAFAGQCESGAAPDKPVVSGDRTPLEQISGRIILETGVEDGYLEGAGRFVAGRIGRSAGDRGYAGRQGRAGWRHAGRGDAGAIICRDRRWVSNDRRA